MNNVNYRINEFVMKAVLQTSTGGQLSAENADQFINTVIAQSELLQKVDVYRMKAASRNIDALLWATRQMRSATEGSAISQTGSLTIPRKTLTTKEVQIAPDVTKQWFEENVEGEGAESKLRTLFAAAMANDVVDLSINGNEDSAVTFEAINDGWIKLALEDTTVNDVDISALGSDLKKAFRNVMKGLPVKYRSQKNMLVFLVSPDVEENYREQISDRATALGDAALTANIPLTYSGVQVYSPYSWPDGYIMLTFWKNLALGFGRDITVESEYKPRDRNYEYTITAKHDVEIAVGEMVSLGAF